MTTNPQTDARAADLLVADARRAVHESLIVFAAPEADRVRALIADLETAVEGRTAIHLAAVSVPASAPTDEAAEVEERTARYLFDQDWTRTLDVDAARKLLAAVLPARDDQAADWGALVRETGRLRLEAIELHDQATELDTRVAEFELRGTAEIYASIAELVRAMADEHPSNAAWVQDCQHIADRIAAVSGSGRVADETQAPYPPVVEWRTETQRRDDHWSPWCGGRYELDEARADFAETVATDRGRHAWRLVRATTTYAVEVEQPAVVSQPDGEA